MTGRDQWTEAVRAAERRLSDAQAQLLTRMVESQSGGIGWLSIASLTNTECAAARELFERGYIRPGALMSADITEAGRAALAEHQGE